METDNEKDCDDKSQLDIMIAERNAEPTEIAATAYAELENGLRLWSWTQHQCLNK